MTTNKMSRTRAACAGISFALLAVGCAQEPASAPAPAWKHYSAELIDNGTPAQLAIWVKGTDVVRRYSRNGKLMYDERCEGLVSTSRYFDPAVPDNKDPFTSKTVQSNVSPEKCFDFTTYQEFRLWDLGMAGQLNGGAEILYGGRRSFRFTDGKGAEIVLDAQTHLPLVYEMGAASRRTRTTYNFTVVAQDDGAPVSAPEAKWFSIHSHLSESREQSAVALRLAKLPSEIAGQALGETYVQTSSNSTMHVAIWGKAKQEIQLISNTATLPKEMLGFSEDRTEWNAQEGNQHVKVYAQNPSMLTEALKVLRPEALLAASVSTEPSSGTVVK